MAEGFTRSLHHGSIQAESAGSEIHGLDPLAVRVMAEAGIDISSHRSRSIDELGEREFDFVVTVCDRAKENCPFFPAVRSFIHRSFDDPPVLAEHAQTEEEALSHYRRVRDEIRSFIDGLPAILAKGV